MLEAIVQDGNRCGEGPIWDPAGRLLWVDIGGGTVFEHVPASGRTRLLSRDVAASAIALHRSGGLVLGGASGLHLWEETGTRRLVSLPGINDLIADRRGRIYAGTCFWGAGGLEKPGALHLVEPGGAVRIVEEGIGIANGLGWSPDDRMLYFTDSAARRIYAYDVKPDGTLAGRRVFVQVPSVEGIPDGLTVDAEGFVWSAQWYGSQVVRYDPEGKVERRIALPVRQVASLAFGGDDLTDLYITTAGELWQSELAPPGYDFGDPNLGGSLYRVRLGIAGRPEHLANL